MRLPFAREEMMLSALLVVSGLAPVLQADPPDKDPFWIKLDMSERPAEGDAPPVVTYAGSTNLPNGTRLDMEVYYRRYFLGRNLVAKALPVLDGKFALDLHLYPNSKKNLAGPHLIRTWVYLDQQPPAIQKVLAGGERNRLYEEIYHIGTPEEAEDARRKVYERMTGLLDTYQAIHDEIKKHGRSLKGNFNRTEWKQQQKQWETRTLAVEREARAVNEFLALDLDVFVKTNFEEIRTGISVVANWTAIALEHPGDISIAQSLQAKRLRVAKLIDEVREAADPDRGNIDTVLADLDLMRSLLREALDNPQGPHRDTRVKFIKVLFRVEPRTPETRHIEIVAIASEFREFFKALPGDIPAARQLQATMDARLAGLKTAFKSSDE